MLIDFIHAMRQGNKTIRWLTVKVREFTLALVAVLIATKTNEVYSQVMCNIRTCLSMDIMRSVLVAVRGVRGKAKKTLTAPISNVSFNLIPEERIYEG